MPHVSLHVTCPHLQTSNLIMHVTQNNYHNARRLFLTNGYNDQLPPLKLSRSHFLPGSCFPFFFAKNLQDGVSFFWVLAWALVPLPQPRQQTKTDGVLGGSASNARAAAAVTDGFAVAAVAAAFAAVVAAVTAVAAAVAAVAAAAACFMCFLFNGANRGSNHISLRPRPSSEPHCPVRSARVKHFQATPHELVDVHWNLNAI